MNYWWFVPIALFLPVVLLLRIYLRNRFGSKDKNYGGIQRSSRLEPPKEAEEDFLPGSLTERSEDLEAILQELEKQAQLSRQAKKQKSQKRLFVTRKEILRSYIIDSLLDKPKF